MSQQPKKEYTLIPVGTHAARLYSIVDLGVQDYEWKGEKKSGSKIRFTWELPNETQEFDGVKKPLVIGNNYTLSMGNKANLRKVIEGMLGITLRDEEAANFDMESFKGFLGKECMLSVIHTKKGDKTYANIGSVVPLMKGMTMPPQFNKDVIYEIGTSDNDVFQSLPNFVQDIILKSHELRDKDKTEPDEETDEEDHSDYPSDDINPEEIPF